MNTKPLILVLAVILLLVIGYFVFAGGASAPTEMATTDSGTPAADTDTPPATTVTITYGPNGFSPATVTVTPGTTVTWVNESGGRMWVASDEHPTHTEFDGSSREEHCANGAPASAGVFDQCTASERFSFTFTKEGTWAYHNHSEASARGIITVR